ncbi:MAG TPA: DUF3306 domain-containing protein [Noviherbaspirillum sp.]|uniref:DUF3306 domain-containing protein n=1 Tax=Noviherbaspirillum sp. TaxID=1926288 RepID=UPI002B49D7CF|nr:DUF3306 domain-containing protein [Noviherbaspirillum sp.]HJV83853.1 DUF3306 domain-containing protein [Noviherbaspirillum sp.]
MAAESFFRRWSRRKAESGKARESVAPPQPEETQPAAEPPRLPTLDDVRRLTPDSDYSLFLAKGTDPAVRRAALKTLFADPHFNSMDGLDIYMGDYTKYTPLSPVMLAALQHARSLLPPAEKDEQADTSEPAAAATAAPEDDSPPEPDPDADAQP